MECINTPLKISNTIEKLHNSYLLSSAVIFLLLMQMNENENRSKKLCF